MITADNSARDRAEKFFRIILLVLPYSSAIYFFSFNTADPDLWGHIKFGQDLWIAGKIPEFDIYSYTAFEMKWINHEWLSELIMYGIYTLSGSPGLLIVKLITGLTILSVMTRITLQRTFNPIAYGVCLSLSTAVMSPGFMVRPQLATFLFAAYFIYVFYNYLEHNKNLLWSLPLAMILWVNSHGGFLIGAGLFPVVVASETANCVIKGKKLKHIPAMVFWLFITEASMLVNPYGLHLLFFLHDSLSISREISEWSSISLFDLSYVRFKIMVILVIFLPFIKKGKNRYWEISVIIIALVYSIMYERHTPVFAIFAAPFICEKISAVMEIFKIGEKTFSMKSLLVIGVLTSLLAGYQIYFTSAKYLKTRFNIIVDPGIYPVYAVQFIKENGIKGDIMLPFEWGEYAIWKLYPDCRVSIDGRFRTVYPNDVLEDHFNALKDRESWVELIGKYPADILLLNRHGYSEEMVHAGNDWTYIYSDGISLIFIKDSKSQKNIIKKLEQSELVYPEKEILPYFP
jgi:hypothetical protein